MHVNDPRTAPFPGSTPPPALLHRIAKTAVRLKVRTGNKDKQPALSDIKKRIIFLIAESNDAGSDHLILSPALRNAGSGPIRYLTARANSISAAASASYFPMPLKSPFHEQGELFSKSAGKRKFNETGSLGHTAAGEVDGHNT